MDLHALLILSPLNGRNDLLAQRVVDLLLTHRWQLTVLYHGDMDFTLQQSKFPSLQLFKLKPATDDLDYISKHRAEIIVAVEHFLETVTETQSSERPCFILCDEGSVWSTDLAACLGLPIMLLHTGSLIGLKSLLEKMESSVSTSDDDANFDFHKKHQKWTSVSSIDCQGLSGAREAFAGILCFDNPRLYPESELDYLTVMIADKLHSHCRLWCLDPTTEICSSDADSNVLAICLPQSDLLTLRILSKLASAFRALGIDYPGAPSYESAVPITSKTIKLTNCNWLHLLQCICHGVEYFIMFPAAEDELLDAETLTRFNLATVLPCDASAEHIVPVISSHLSQEASNNKSIKSALSQRDKCKAAEVDLVGWLRAHCSCLNVLPGSIP
eukprot:Gregarina_sp_Poly_1__3755@NODE_2112_length_2667_cov_91_117692_g1362_i0_p1_GENE_NODE_2112_length_2667_cov_91_117692_g1362_i0NODE_2112_length_2667_cov_91_117692_g1362_i0_p1_ORF_typecomplete_len386_score39_06_NODE_2112_length_2667_cov_91_117692_g1362_i013982555